MDRKMIGVVGAAVASAVAFLWWQSEDDDLEIEKESYGLKGDDPKKTSHLMDLGSDDDTSSLSGNEEDEDTEEENAEEDEEDEDSEDEENEEDEEEDEDDEEEVKPKPSKKKSKKNK